MALTIAGSDSGGGAGIQADLKTFERFGAHGACAITCVTAQNPREVLSVQPVKPAMLRDQLRAVFDRLRPAAVKVGMLYSRPLIDVVADFLSSRPSKNRALVIDPVMVSTSGSRLLRPAAVRALKERLLPLATLVTPNLSEAGILLGREVQTLGDAIMAAREIHARWGCAALVTGGHGKGPDATDALFTGKKMRLFFEPFIRGAATHGSGCTLSAGIAAGLARRHGLSRAIEEAKANVSRAIRQRYGAGGHEHLAQ